MFSFKDIVEEQIRLLNESKKIEDLQRIPAFSNIPQNMINFIVTKYDPTAKQNGYVGKYGIYLLNQYLLGFLNSRNSESVQDTLTKFDQIKGRLKDRNINNYSIGDIEKLVNQKPVENDNTWPTIDQMLKMEMSQRYLLVKQYDDGWSVYVPLSWEAARKLGGSASWCTSASNPYAFWDYTIERDVNLFMYLLNGRPMYQFAIGEGIRNSTNEEVSFNDDNMPPKIEIDTITKVRNYSRPYFKKFFSNEKKELMFASLSDFDATTGKEPVDGMIGVMKNGRYGAYDTEMGRLVSALKFGPCVYNNNGVIILDRVPHEQANVPQSFYDMPDEELVAFTRDGEMMTIGEHGEEILYIAYNMVANGKKEPIEAFDQIEYDQDERPCGIIDIFDGIMVSLDNGEVTENNMY